jgi:hypothetical protein
VNDLDPVALAREPVEVKEYDCCVCAREGRKRPGPFTVLGGTFCRRHAHQFRKKARRRALRLGTRMDIPKGKR